MDSNLDNAEVPRVSSASSPDHGFSFSHAEGVENGTSVRGSMAAAGTANTGNCGSSSNDGTCHSSNTGAPSAVTDDIAPVTAAATVTELTPNGMPAPAPALKPVLKPAPTLVLSGGSSSAQVPFQFQIPKHFQFHVPVPVPVPIPHPSAEQSPLNFANCHDSTSSAQPPSTHRILHAHRQNHSSSKLPTSRISHVKRRSIALPSSLQRRLQDQRPPSPISPVAPELPDPGLLTETQAKSVNQLTSAQAPAQSTETPRNQNINHSVIPQGQSSENLDPVRSRASTLQAQSVLASATKSPAHVKRSISLDSTNVHSTSTGATSAFESPNSTVTGLQQHASDSPNTALAQDTDTHVDASTAEAKPRDRTSGQRELLLPKTLKRTLSDERRASVSKRPPVSYRPPTNSSGPGVTASIPPIRSFRSSGERRSLVLDMNLRTARNFEGGDNYSDSTHRDRTLRALEGRRVDDVMQWTPPDSAGERGDGDDSGDLFLKIAREDPSSRTADNGKVHTDSPNAISRVTRSVRRPLSVALSSAYRSPSPPRISRRLSEHESSRPSVGSQEQGERSGPPISYRGHSREPHSEDLKFRGATTPVRASPLTPRTLPYQDPNSDSATAHRRRQPSVDRTSAAPSRMASLKQSAVNYSHPRAYSSSPLVAQAMELPKHEMQPSEPTHVEGTDSTTSTAAPSTVWDELEELKSRIHRLELTGKLPPTSSAAISRASDERPPTAHTNATTLSASPKRNTSNAIQSTEPAALPKDNHPLLHSALAKSKEFLAPAVYDALEAATADALALVVMMGTAGQPGPISSRTSNIESGTGTVTDRQLRKKADSVCRSLTELCLALSEGAGTGIGVAKTQQTPATPIDDATVTSPTVTQFSGIATQRRPSAPANRAIELTTSPRAVSRFEEKRIGALGSSTLPSPRYTSNLFNATIDAQAPAPAPAAAGRKTSLLFSRTRRAGTEEPEDGRRTSLISRSRRAGTEEPEDQSDRKPILTRGRRATLDDGEEEYRFRTPSRAVTEVNGTRPREYLTHVPPLPTAKETADTLANSALPRRRLGSTTLNTRLAPPTAVSTTTTTTSAIATANRRYFDRSAPGREASNDTDKLAEDRTQRQFSLARSGSLNRRATRQSLIAAPSTTAGYLK